MRLKYTARSSGASPSWLQSAPGVLVRCVASPLSGEEAASFVQCMPTCCISSNFPLAVTFGTKKTSGSIGKTRPTLRLSFPAPAIFSARSMDGAVTHTRRVRAPSRISTLTHIMSVFLLSLVLYGPSRTSRVSSVFEDELGRRSHARTPQVVTVKLRKLLLEPLGERLLRSHEPPERLFRVLGLHVSHDHLPPGCPGDVHPYAADAQAPPETLVLAEAVPQQILGKPPPLFLPIRQDGQDQDGCG